MSQQERWDVVLEFLGGPMAGTGQHVLRGPVVRIGANPGPGGLRLVGYRGLDARQCVITAYSGGTSSVGPVGSNQVRMAPHPNVRWKDIDPIHSPVYLHDGCAIHLGPVGRGATLRFVECRRFGSWEQGRLVSDVSGSHSSVPSVSLASMSAVPSAIDAKGVGQVRTTTMPRWFIGCMLLLVAGTASSLVALGALLLMKQQVVEIGPVVSKSDLYSTFDLETESYDENLYNDLQRPFNAFVMEPNVAAMGSNLRQLDDPTNWDPRFFEATTGSLGKQAGDWKVYRMLDRVRGDYAEVVKALRRHELPEVFAGIPYVESRYNTIDYPSAVCAGGYWQFMPEVVNQMRVKHGVDFELANCRLESRDSLFTPTGIAAPPGISRRGGAYVEIVDGEPRCLITGCSPDDRQDLYKSTRAAMAYLGEPFNDPDLRASGAAVQIAIMSVNAGYDDGRYGTPKSTNLRPAYLSWVETHGIERSHLFYGENITTAADHGHDQKGSKLPPATQQYGYTVTAIHLLAVCYYATNYPDEPAFQPWRRHVSGRDGYCNALAIPMADEVNVGRKR